MAAQGITNEQQLLSVSRAPLADGKMYPQGEPLSGRQGLVHACRNEFRHFLACQPFHLSPLCQLLLEVVPFKTAPQMFTGAVQQDPEVVLADLQHGANRLR